MELNIKYGNTNLMATWARSKETKARCFSSAVLTRLYRLRVRMLRRIILRVCVRLEGGQYFSQTLRDILSRYHGVNIGKYSYGPCLVPGHLPPGTCVGNYCSMAEGVMVYRVNHTIDRVSQHPLFFNSALGLLREDAFESPAPLEIGHDVWIGYGAIILPKCRKIGDGAVVGAGSVVTRDVEPFTIVAGNPAKVIRRRVPLDVECKIRESEWWTQPLWRVVTCVPLFMEQVTPEMSTAVVVGMRTAFKSSVH